MNTRPSFMVSFARRLWQATVVATLISAGVSPGRAWAADPWPQMPVPPQANVQWIGESMRINGVPTRIMQFQSRASRQQIVAYYTDRWSRGYEHKPSVRDLGDSTVINQGKGPYLMTIKVADDLQRSSHGLISVARVLGSKPDLDAKQVPLMPGGHVISVVESDDVGKHSRQILILTPQPPTSVSDFYQASFSENGWNQLQGADTPPESARGGSFLVFSQGPTEVQLSIVASHSARGSTVLANVVTKDTGRAGD
jgi:hypothetical protein